MNMDSFIGSLVIEGVKIDLKKSIFLIYIRYETQTSTKAYNIYFPLALSFLQFMFCKRLEKA